MNPENLEVFSGVFQAAAEEMVDVMEQMLLSPGPPRSCSAAIHTAEGKLLALSGDLPLLSGIMPGALGNILRVHPAGSFSSGDCVATNDPDLTGSPLTHLCLVSPLFSGSRIMALAAVLVRQGDVGGSTPGSMSTLSRDIFQEGIRIPPLKIIRKGVLNAGFLSIISSNVRNAEEFTASLWAQVSAAKRAEKNLGILASKYGHDRLKRCMLETMNHSERLVRSALKGLGPTSLGFDEILEEGGAPGDPARIKGSVKYDDFLTVDFTGTSARVTSPFNITGGQTMACVYTACRKALGPDIPFNDGFLRPFSIIVPEGSLLGAGLPAALAHGGTCTAPVTAGAVYRCLSEAVHGREQNAGPGGAVIVKLAGIRPGSESFFSWTEILAGGQDASALGDGRDGIKQSWAGGYNTPAETVECNYPLIIDSCGLIIGSGGPGKFRGGTGIRKTITLLGDEITVAVSASAAANKTRGLHGGLPGMPAGVSLTIPGAKEGKFKVSSGEYTATLGKGTVITLETSGGGGFGSPLERDPESVRVDVLEGFVPENQALELYGVVLKGEDLQVDREQTAARRQHLRTNHIDFK